jgi:hypothetical protein
LQDGDNSEHIWSVAASGTADAALTWSEAMRIDSSGNLLVGQSSTTIPGVGNTTAGVSIRGTDGSFFSRALGSGDTNNVVSVNRSTADGNILGFQKDGTTVGSIGTVSGDIRIGGLDDNHASIRFAASSKAVLPVKNSDGGLSDNTTDLGASNARFKDLYLSGNAYVGSSGFLSNNSGEYIKLDNIDDTIEFSTGSAERMRIDASGNLVFRKDDATVGSIKIFNATEFGLVSQKNLVLTQNTTTERNLVFSSSYFSPFASDDNTIDLGRSVARFKDLYLSGGISIGDAKTVGHRDISLKYDLVYMTAGVISPADDDGSDNDNSIDLGKSAARFNDIYATNSTIQTSDRNEKQDIEELSDAEQRVAVACKSLLRKFRWKSAVQDKGDDARIHFGIVAQDLQDAFEAEGLDAGRYAMFISTTWTDEDGEEQTRMGVRYSELLAFIISAI